MSVVSGQSVAVEFTTRNGTTGVGVNADSLPTGTLVKNGVDNAATVTITNPNTGSYLASVTLPTLANQDIVQMRIAATVNAVADKAIVWTDTCDLNLSSGAVLLQATQTGVTIPAVTTVGTLTTYTGNTPQTGDSYARLGAPSGASIDADILTRLATSGYTAPPSTAAIVAAIGNVTVGGYASGEDPATLILAAAVESGVDVLQVLRVLAAACAGVLSGAATTTVTIEAAGNPGTTRITATVDSSGDRSAVVITA